ncbi:hypothetical protein NP284_02985 [Rhodopseudomonas pseudopalustris]|uniref:hypothetical protein n=1 Tax=Rhodopseudomonas pseudopalustris TaxID=1513892 RepID=UPI003F9A4952
MRSAIIIVLLAIAALFYKWTEPDPAALALVGEWYQIESNAGKCADCSLVVARDGGSFAVKASNGWSAVVRPSQDGQPAMTGKGRWLPNSGGPAYRAKEFDLHLAMKGEVLSMLMLIPGADNKTFGVEATFKKPVS